MFGGTRLTVTWPALAAGAATAGIGFTVSLLVATLAFDGRLLEEAKIGVLATAIISPCARLAGIPASCGCLPQDVRARQLGATADTIIDLADDVDPERDHIRGAGRRAGHARRVRRLRVPVLRRGRRRSSTKLRATARRRPALRLPPPAARPTCTRTRRWPPRRRRRPAPRARSGRCTTACSRTRTRSRRPTSTATPRRLGLDLDRFARRPPPAALRRRASREDVRSADASGVSGTPTFFVNGRRHQGVYDVESLARAVRAAAAPPGTLVPAR